MTFYVVRFMRIGNLFGQELITKEISFDFYTQIQEIFAEFCRILKKVNVKPNKESQNFL